VDGFNFTHQRLGFLSEKPWMPAITN